MQVFHCGKARTASTRCPGGGGDEPGVMILRRKDGEHTAHPGRKPGEQAVRRDLSGGFCWRARRIGQQNGQGDIAGPAPRNRKWVDGLTAAPQGHHRPHQAGGTPMNPRQRHPKSAAMDGRGLPGRYPLILAGWTLLAAAFTGFAQICHRKASTAVRCRHFAYGCFRCSPARARRMAPARYQQGWSG